MDQCRLTIRAQDITITETYLADWVKAFYGRIAILAGMDEWEVSFRDIADEDIGNVYATIMLDGFKHAMQQFLKPVVD